MSRVTIGPGVRDDLDAIWDYIGIENGNPAAASRLIEMLHQKFLLLAHERLLGESRDDLGKGVRVFVARPFVIVYRLKTDGVEIVQVVHSARDIRAVLRQGRMTT